MIECPNCGHENEEGTKICTYCGEPLVDLIKENAATRALGDTDFEEGVLKWGSARFNVKMNLVVGVDGEERSLIFDANEIEELVIGREDPKTGDAPEINLTPYQGLEKGVSRKHSSIIRKDGSLFLVDKGSANGTFLNGQRLVAEQPRVLRDGDDVRLGHLVLRINFERS